MEMKGISNWIQIATGVALLIGLGLVVWELQQSRDVAVAQLTSDGFSNWRPIDIANMGESPATVLAKACRDPQSLTDEDLEVLGAYYSAIVSSIDRNYKIEERSGLYDGVWRRTAQALFGFVLNTVAGRTWWEAEKVWYPHLQDISATIAEAVSPRDECWTDSWRNRIAEASISG